ncbi:MAG: AAA family ATPase [Melioribacteraceae bacterium]
MNLTNYIKAGVPLVCIETLEIKRAVQDITTGDSFPILKWNPLEGIQGEYKDIAELLEYAKTLSQTVIICENINWFFEKKEIQQMILNTYQALKNKQVCIVCVGTDAELPDTLKKIFHHIDYSLPSLSAFQGMVENFKQYGLPIENDIACSCLGLGYEETENSLALQAIETKEITRQGVLSARKALIEKTGFMSIARPENMESVGGMEEAKRFLSARMKAFDPGNEHMPRLRSILLVGVPGCGKSLFAKALANIMQADLIQADAGAMKGGLVGETEKKTRLFTKTVDSIGKCVVLLDEIEKMLSMGSGDSGTSKGQVGHFLSWFNDRASDSVIVATSNDLSSLPPEFLRPGRWDAIFFVGFPNLQERKAIIEIMNKKHNSKLDCSIASKLEQWTGAEIEQLAKDSHFEEIEEIIASMPTMQKTRKDDIKRTMEQAKHYRNASTSDSGKEITRKLNL